MELRESLADIVGITDKWARFDRVWRGVTAHSIRIAARLDEPTNHTFQSEGSKDQRENLGSFDPLIFCVETS